MALRWIGDKPIIWANAKPIYRRTYAALGGDALKRVVDNFISYFFLIRWQPKTKLFKK